ncbi:hypothetical protein G6O69_23290 [Pseudenhygromyxa sp. WMMC2535]|uniref:hypothetical protein n=1 Tax=Pseudenhygromyxa sp. WMMC2535 TaxID=2712867 RepID=UPI001594F089|nr:hypothetical protein [Pseudenhygromyxa sp. WMMC2535]NVB40784.1 hypothetical protein [Pseudenhygromyxa sp. WMMC2535]
MPDALRRRQPPVIPRPDAMTRLASTLASVAVAAGLSQAMACKAVTTVHPDMPIEVQAKPPAPPLPNLPPLPQPPPPPPRVVLAGDVLTLDEALSFDEAGTLSSEHDDILAEVAAWLGEHGEVLELRVEAWSVGKGSRRAQQKRGDALAKQVVDALVAKGVASERLVAKGVGKSEDEQRHVLLRVTNPAPAPNASTSAEAGGQSK